MELRRLLVHHPITGLAVALAAAGCGSENPYAGKIDDQSYAGTRVCAGGTTLTGIDVSVYQGTVNWPAVKAAGKSFAIAKATEGTGVQDSQFPTNWAGIKAAGLVRGAYHFFHPDIDGPSQADYFVNYVNAHGGFQATDLPPMLDWESNYSASTVNAITQALAFVQRAEALTGKRPFIYTDNGFWDGMADPNFASYDLDIANWGASCPTVPAEWSTWNFWQYQGCGGTSPGVSGPVDLDEWNGTLADLQAFAMGTVVCSDYACGSTYYWTCQSDGNLHSCSGGTPTVMSCPAGCHFNGACANDSCNAISCTSYTCGTTAYWTCSTDGNLHKCDSSGKLLTTTCTGGCRSNGVCVDDSCLAAPPPPPADAGVKPDSSVSRVDAALKVDSGAAASDSMGADAASRGGGDTGAHGGATTGGCSCSVASRRAPPPVGGLLLLALLLVGAELRRRDR